MDNFAPKLFELQKAKETVNCERCQMNDESVPTNHHSLTAASDLLPSADAVDPVIEAYKKDVDRTLLRENLKLSPQQRSEKFVSFMKGIQKLRRVAAQESDK